MSKANLLDRRAVVKSLLADRKGAIRLADWGLTYDIAAPAITTQFYLWARWGGRPVMIALGWRWRSPSCRSCDHGRWRDVMGLGSLATVGLQKPGNL